MSILLLALAILMASGALALILGRSPRLSTAFGAGGAMAGCAVGIVPAVASVVRGSTVSLKLAWDVPYGSFSVALDPLSAWFLLPILGLSGLAALQGAGDPADDRRRGSGGVAWFHFNVLVAGMAGVVLARNGVLFLVAWEVMSLALYFLLTREDEEDGDRVEEAGRTYLIAAHLGAAFLLGFFLLLGRRAGSLDFDAIAAAGMPGPATAGLLFVLALVGFGTKAGFMPLHVWLPGAYRGAPGHVAAVSSGVMVKVGIYGLVRAFTLLPAPPAWWGWLLIGVGILSGVWGILLALAQHDLKRLLAYSTVENVGIIALGLGLGLVGVNRGAPMVALLGFTGALFHVVNHALFKGLLFLGAGAVLRAAGTMEIDRLGGLARRMPWVSTSMLVGAVAIAGLPPLNGFASEFLIYLGAFRGGLSARPIEAVPAHLIVAALALIGGLSAVCFTKVVGIALLGEPRSEGAAEARTAGPLLVAPVVILAAGCLLVGLASPGILAGLVPIAAGIARLEGPPGTMAEDVVGPLSSILTAGAVLLGLIAVLGLARRALLVGRPVGSGPTWGCGYARPTSRMQYTGSSYAQPATALFGALLAVRRRVSAPTGPFPVGGAFQSETPDPATEAVYRPAFRAVARGAGRLRLLQHGRIHLYVLYIALTVLILLIWYLGPERG